MHSYSMFEWEKMIKKAGFNNIALSQFGQKKDWKGTLILSGIKD